MSGNPYVGPARIKCAGQGCPQERDSVNRWFVVNSATQFECRKFPENAELGLNDKPVCGSACAQKLFEQFLSK